MTPHPSRESSALPGLLTLAAAFLATACTAPNPDFRPLGLVVADATAKQSGDLVFDMRIDAQDVPVTVDYEAVDDSAVKGREYLETKGTLTIEPGTTTASLVVPTLLYNHIPGDVNVKLNVTVTRRTVSDSQTGTGTITPIAELARFTSIEAGAFHACGVTSQRTVKCWGSNFGGQLGNGSTTTSFRMPVDVVGLTNVSIISAATEHTCAVTAGAVKCWGRNSFGELGNNSTTDSLVPVDVANLSGVTAVSAGGGHTCAVTGDGKVKCWGNNSNGQLGNGSTTNSLTPVDVVSISGVTAVAAGGSHTCAVIADGKVKCWGYNSNGQLGNGLTTDSLTPVDVKNSDLTSLTGVTSISAGSHTCATTMGGAVYCWGDNTSGQLGNNSTTSSPVARIALSDNSGATALIASYDHTCAVVSQGAVKCWGSNIAGEVGNNSTANALAPVDVAGSLTGITAITAGFGSTLALTEQGTVKGWGGNGLGSNVAIDSPVPVDVPGFTNVTAIVSDGGGVPNRICALTAQKTVKCTSHADLLTAVDVAGLTDITAIAIGFGSTCGLTTQGTVKCVGRSPGGQMPAPVDVVGLTSVSAIAANSLYACALTKGRVKCWGLDDNSTAAPMAVDVGITDVASIASGGFGTYAVTTQGTVMRWDNGMAPTNFAGLTGVTSIAAGFRHACALTSQGVGKCWGSNHYSQLGNGSTVDSAVPVDVTGLSATFTSISVGSDHTCAVTLEGTAVCWGADSAFGDGSWSATTFPSAALGGQKVLAVLAGYRNTSFITPHHTVRRVGSFQYNSKVPVDTIYVLK